MTGLEQTKAADQLPPEPVTPAVLPIPGAPEPPPVATTIADDDPDMIALKAAEAELEAEEKGIDPGKPAEPTAADKGALPAPVPAPGAPVEPAGKEPTAPDEPEQITIPKARFDQVRERARDAQIAQLKAESRADTLQDLIERGVIQPHQVPPGTAGAEVPKTIPEQVTAIRDQQKNLAAEFEAGRLGAQDWEGKRQALDDQVLELRLSEHQAPQPTEDLLLSERTDALIKDYPILDHLTAEQLTPVKNIAMEHMILSGTPYEPNSPSSLLDLRQRVATLADQAWHMEGVHSPSRDPKAPATPAQPAATPPATPLTAATPAPEQPGVTAAERKAKLDLAAQQPPTLTSAPGTTIGGIDALTEETFLKMTTEEVAALPPEVLDRIEKQGL